MNGFFAFLPRFCNVFAALLLQFALALILQAQQSPPNDADVVRINTDLITLNATVVNSKGEYVHDLKQSDFRLREDGREQRVSNFSIAETPFAAIVLLDTSGSMEQRLTLARSAAIRFLDGLRTDDAAAVYQFDSDIKEVQDFSSGRDLAPLAFGLRAKGLTVLNDAVQRAAADLSQRPEKRRAIIVLSDGADTHSATSADKALDRALAAGATIYTVDMAGGDTGLARVGSGSAALRSFADKSGGRYIATPGGRKLREAFAQIVEELGNQYTLGYQSTNHARDGRWRTIELTLSSPEAIIVRTRKGYRAPKS